jgi:hypothetical protein
MLPGAVTLAVGITDETTVLWHGVLLLATVLALGLVWSFLRARWAPRSIESWAGKGVHPGLDPVRAGLLLRVHPSRLVAAALEPLLADGRVRIVSGAPLRLHWPEPPEEDARLEVLRAALGPDGRPDPDGVVAFLEAVYDDVDAAMAPFSGRATAVRCRRRVRNLWERALRGEDAAAADRPWLVLQDPAKVIDRIPGGPVGERLHDLVRLTGVFRARLLDPGDLETRARAATRGYFRYRRDLDVVRTARGRYEEHDRTRPPPRSPFRRKLDALATALDGQVMADEPSLPLLLFYSSIRPGVTGRHRGRVASVVLGNHGEAQADLACSAACEFQVVPRAGADGAEALFGTRVLAGTKAFDDDFVVRHRDCGELGEWMEHARTQDLLRDLEPFTEIRGLATRLRVRFAYDRERFLASDILDRFPPLVALAEHLEERRVASGAQGPSCSSRDGD